MKRIAPALLLAAIAATPLFAQAVVPVHFRSGATSSVITDRIVGRQYKDYRVGLAAGQTLRVDLSRLRGSPYFNVIEPGAGDVGIFIGSMGGAHFEGQTRMAGNYVIRVYQMRAAERRGETAGYRLTIAATGAGHMHGASVPSHKHGDALVAGTPYHATANLRCRVDASMRWGDCKAGVVRRSNSAATVHLDTLDGGQRTINFRDGRAVSSDASSAIRVTRRGDTSVVSIGRYEVYEIPDALPFGG